MTRDRTLELGVSQTLLLHEEVEMLALSRWLIERNLLDEKVLVSRLDLSRNLGRRQLSSLRECAGDAEGKLRIVGSQDAPPSESESSLSSSRSMCSSSRMESMFSEDASSRTSSETRMGT